MLNDWSAYFLQAERALKKSSEAMLLKDYDTGIAELIKAKAFLEMVQAAIYRN